MAKPIIMPQVGQDIETGVIVEWCVKENDEIKKGDVVAIVESDKATFEVEAYESGTLLKILYKAGDDAKVLEPIAYIGQPGEKIEQEPQISTTAPPAGPTAEQKSENKIPQTAKPGASVSPSAKRIARERQIDLAEIKGTGPGGRITKQDVLAAAGAAIEEQPCASETANLAAGDEEIPFSKMRKRIAQRLTHSKQTIPHFYLFLDVDMTAACRWRADYNKKAQVKITFNDMIVKAAALALTKFRQLNAHMAEDKLILRKDINIGTAVAVDDGLIVPVVPNADQNDIEQISRISAENAEGAKKGLLKAQALGTFTVSNLGMYSINGFLPIINPPECAILGVGNIKKSAVVLEDGSIGAGDIMTLALASDHRTVDGTVAAQFLNTIKDNLENFGA